MSIRPTPAMDNQSIRERHNRASKEIARLMRHGETRHMSIPVNFEYDTDMLLGASLDDVDYLLRENAVRLEYIATLERQNKQLRRALEERNVSVKLVLDGGEITGWPGESKLRAEPE